MDLLSNLKNFFKTNFTTIDNNVFRLHYKATAVTLIAFSILVTGKQYIGDPIDCIPKKDIPENLMDTFCWVHTTFSVEHAWNKPVGIDGVPYPGVDKYVKGEKRVYHAYYQWVCFVLFLQAILFYTPRYFWKAIEGGRIKNLILGLNSPILSEDTKISNRKMLVDYLASNRNNHNYYFIGYVAAEVMNFVNVVGQIYLIDVFLGGEFTSYGTQVLQFTEWDSAIRFDPMVKVFPRMTKCTFHKFGDGGSVESLDTMCLLPINIINEKIYVFIWFWFVILAVLSGAMLVYRAAIIFWPQSRFMATRYRARIADQKSLQAIVSSSNAGDWFLLDLLAKNLDSLNFRDVVSDFARRLDGTKSDYV